jgi:ADP-ribose pyrophosphatase YjhB (NUDIX family)
MDIGETFAQSAIREVKEAAGFDIRIDRIIGIYSDPGHVSRTIMAK